MTRSPALIRDRLFARFRVFVGIGVVLAASALCYWYPPLRVVRVPKPSVRNSANTTVASKTSARQFWEIYLPSARQHAVEIQTLFDAHNCDPHRAHDEFSRRVGLGNTHA